MPQCVDWTGFSFGYFLPEMAIQPPRSGSSTPEMILMSVDLPEPVSPTRQCTAPPPSVRSTLRSARTPPKRFEMPDISRKVAKGSSCDETALSRNRFDPCRIPERKIQECDKTRLLGLVCS